MSTNIVIRRQAALDFPEMKPVFPVDFGTYLDTYFIFTEENLRLVKQAFVIHHALAPLVMVSRQIQSRLRLILLILRL